jgi:hypothetical protein
MIVVNFIEVITVVVIPIDVTLVGIVTDVKLSQPTKVASLIDVTLVGIVTDVKLLQPLKASDPYDSS